LARRSLVRVPFSLSFRAEKLRSCIIRPPDSTSTRFSSTRIRGRAGFRLWRRLWPHG
jgi:hypothetical protein